MGEFENPEVSGGFLGGVSDRIKGFVEKSAVVHNTEYNYDSDFKTYGYTLIPLPDGTFFLDPAGVPNWVDRKGDQALRRWDDNVIKEAGKMLRRHPKAFFSHLVTGPKRSRGNVEQILENIERLRLSDYYGSYEQGIQIKKPEIFSQGINLLDLYKDISPLHDFDRFKALETSGEYIKTLHDNYGATGELHPLRIFFQKHEGTELKGPVLWVPDIIFNNNKYSNEQLKSLTEPKAVEVLEFLAATTGEELKLSGNQELAEKAVASFLEGYNDPKVTEAVISFIRRGRLTISSDRELPHTPDSENPEDHWNTLPESFSKKMRGSVLQAHNAVHLGATKDVVASIKPLILHSAQEVLSNQVRQQTESSHEE